MYFIILISFFSLKIKINEILCNYDIMYVYQELIKYQNPNRCSNKSKL